LKKKDDPTTRLKILNATIKLLFSTAPGELTSRNIAKAAGVNVAALNYYFKSKEALINEAVASGTEVAFNNGMKILLDPSKKPAERLTHFLAGYTHGLMEFPHLTRTAFTSLFMEASGNNPYGTYTREMVQKIGTVIGEARGSADENDNRLKALMVVSSVLFPFVVSQSLKQEGVIDYKDRNAREKYIATLITAALGYSPPIPLSRERGGAVEVNSRDLNRQD
jgi:AcrR family transcriptional regulator